MRDPRTDDEVRFPCPICASDLLKDFDEAEFPRNYRGLICRKCDEKAVNSEGFAPEEYWYDDGDNPVFIDSTKCWRRYRFGGWVTMVDPYDCDTLDEFYERVFRAADDEE